MLLTDDRIVSYGTWVIWTLTAVKFFSMLPRFPKKDILIVVSNEEFAPIARKYSTIPLMTLTHSIFRAF